MSIDQSFSKEAEVAKHVGYSLRAIRKWRAEGKGPSYFRVGRSIRYRMCDVEAWLKHHQVRLSQTARKLGAIPESEVERAQKFGG